MDDLKQEIEYGKFYLNDWGHDLLCEARSGRLVTDEGECWRYHLTHADANGQYDILYRPKYKNLKVYKPK